MEVGSGRGSTRLNQTITIIIMRNTKLRRWLCSSALHGTSFLARFHFFNEILSFVRKDAAADGGNFKGDDCKHMAVAERKNELN